MDAASLRLVNGSGLPEAGFTLRNWRSIDPVGRKLAQINHYIVRDPESFVLKNMRGSAHQSNRDIGTEYWAQGNFNDDVDLGLYALAPRLRLKMAELDMATGGTLGRMHKRAHILHHEKFDKGLANPVLGLLYQHCLQRNGTAGPPPMPLPSTLEKRSLR